MNDILTRLQQMAGEAPVPAKPVLHVAPKASGVRIPVVVLDDGQTFSNVANAKVCFVDPACEEISEDDFEQGTLIQTLLDLRNALNAVIC